MRQLAGLINESVSLEDEVNNWANKSTEQQIDLFNKHVKELEKQFIGRKVILLKIAKDDFNVPKAALDGIWKIEKLKNVDNNYIENTQFTISSSDGEWYIDVYPFQVHKK